LRQRNGNATYVFRADFSTRGHPSPGGKAWLGWASSALSGADISGKTVP
jgi:hypothetical protein